MQDLRNLVRVWAVIFESIWFKCWVDWCLITGVCMLMHVDSIINKQTIPVKIDSLWFLVNIYLKKFCFSRILLVDIGSFQLYLTHFLQSTVRAQVRSRDLPWSCDEWRGHEGTSRRSLFKLPIPITICHTKVLSSGLSHTMQSRKKLSNWNFYISHEALGASGYHKLVVTQPEKTNTSPMPSVPLSNMKVTPV